MCETACGARDERQFSRGGNGGACRRARLPQSGCSLVRLRGGGEMGVVAFLSLDTSGREMAHSLGTCPSSADGRLGLPTDEQRGCAMGSFARAAAPTPDGGRGELGPGIYAGSERVILCRPNSGSIKSGEDSGSRSRRRRGGRGIASRRARCTGRARRARASGGRAGCRDVVAERGDAGSTKAVLIDGAQRGMKVGAAARWAACLIQQSWRSWRQGRSFEIKAERGRTRDRDCDRGLTAIELQWTGARAKRLGALESHVRFLQSWVRGILSLRPDALRGRERGLVRVPALVWSCFGPGQRRRTRCE